MAAEADDIPEDLKTRYSDFSFLGSGAMGRVYKATDNDLLIDVAIKLLLKNETPEALVRFQREAKTASKLGHGNLVKIMDFGVIGGDQLYLVMEYAKGHTLASLIQTQPLELRSAAAIISQVCDGMEHAHSLGVIHRDLKPANIIVDGDDLAQASVKVVDFGIAKINNAAEPAHTVTPQGNVLGTPLYMSPEQISLEEIDRRSDIYSTGCILFHMLTGRLPHESSSALELLEAKLNKQAPRINEIGKHSPVPAAVEHVVGRCLSANPDDRYGTMAELKDALTQAMVIPEKAERVHSERPSLQSQVRKFGPIAAVVLLCLLITGVMVSFYPAKSKHINVVEAAPIGVIKNNQLTVTTAVADYFTRDPKDPKSWIAVPGITDGAVAKLPGQEVEDVDFKDQQLITYRAFQYLSKLPNLQVLAVTDSALDDAGAEYIGKCEKLKKLNLSGTALTDKGLASLTNLPLLVDLNIEGTNVTDEAMKSIAKMKLTRLMAARIKVGNEGLRAISNLQLETLHLESTKVTDEGMKFLPGKNTLKYLYVEATSLGEPGLRQIASYPLKHLYLDGCRNVDDSCVEFVAKTWPNLDKLGLNDTKVTGVGETALADSSQ